jgi:hypothetical protein
LARNDLPCVLRVFAMDGGHERLRSVTLPQQRVADADRSKLLGRRPSLASYIRYLCKMYGFEAPLEAASISFAVGSESYATILRDEARALGFAVKLQDAPVCVFAPVRSAVHALALRFVSCCNRASHELLRSDLAARVPHIARRSVLLPMNAQDLVAACDQLCGLHLSVADELVSAAIAAFDLQHQWFMLGRNR